MTAAFFSIESPTSDPRMISKVRDGKARAMDLSISLSLPVAVHKSTVTRSNTAWIYRARLSSPFSSYNDKL